MGKNPLNDKDVDGNTLNLNLDSDRTRADDGDEQDYICGQCGDIITKRTSDLYSELCFECWENEERGNKYGKA